MGAAEVWAIAHRGAAARPLGDRGRELCALCVALVWVGLPGPQVSVGDAGVQRLVEVSYLPQVP